MIIFLIIFVIGIMRTNEGTVQKIENNNNEKAVSESYLYSSGQKTTNEKMKN